MFGIDTIKVKFNAIRKNDIAIKHLKRVFNAEYIGSDKNRIDKYQGYFKNLKIIFTEDYLVIDGSLARFKNDNNYHLLEPSQINEIIEELNNHLFIDLKKATIQRLDLACNMQRTITSNFIPCVKSIPYLTEQPDKNNYRGLVFGSTNKSIVFYDKVKEVESKLNKPIKGQSTNKGYFINQFEKDYNQLIYEDIQDKQIMRVETRFLKLVGKQTGIYTKQDLTTKAIKENYTEALKPIKFNDTLPTNNNQNMTAKKLYIDTMVNLIREHKNYNLKLEIERLISNMDIEPKERKNLRGNLNRNSYYQDTL